MSLIDYLIPAHYKIENLGIQRNSDGAVIAHYSVAIFNSDGERLDTLHPESVLTAQEKQALAAIIQRDVAQFETNTGLTPLPAQEPEE